MPGFIHLLPCMNHARRWSSTTHRAVRSHAISIAQSLLNYEIHVVFYDAREIEWLAD